LLINENAKLNIEVPTPLFTLARVNVTTAGFIDAVGYYLMDPKIIIMPS